MENFFASDAGADHLMRATIACMPDPACVKDLDGRYVMVNAAMLHVLGINSSGQDEMVGKMVSDFLDDDIFMLEQEDRDVVNLLYLVDNVHRKSCEFLAGDRWFSVSKFPLRDATNTVVGMVAIYRDITELKNGFEAVREYNASLEDRLQANSIELQAANRELEAFCHSVSHDLRAPLRSISGFGNFLLTDNFEQLDAAGKGRLQRILTATRHMGELIDGLLTLAKISQQTISLRKLNLQILAREIVAALVTGSPERQVEVVIAPDLELEADAGLIRVLLGHLIGNAWKFTDQQVAAKIEVGLAVGTGQCIYFVRDNGVGFDMNYAGKLFAPFQRMHTQEQFAGAGIGLAIAKRVIDKHRGKIWIESADHGGTTVFFTFDASV